MLKKRPKALPPPKEGSISLSPTKIKKELPAQLPFHNTIDLVAEKFGGKQAFINNCRVCSTQAVQEVVRLWDEMSPSARKSTQIEDLCITANIPPAKLLGEMASALYLWNGDLAKLIVAVNQPQVVQASVDTALLVGPEGTKDREMQFTMTGLLPKAKGGINIFNTVKVAEGDGSFEDYASTPIEVPALDVSKEKE